jgi:Capsule assembly protein Wzi
MIQICSGVRVRARISFSFAALSLGAVTAVFSQTPATPSNPPSQAAPTSSPGEPVPNRPAYNPQNPTPPVTIPAPQPAPPPVAPPAPTSPETPYRAYMPYGPPEPPKPFDRFSGSTYIPMDSWMYPELTRLYSLGYLDTMFLGMRPWTRRSVLHMLQGSQQEIVTSHDDQAQEILAKLLTELAPEIPDGSRPRGLVYGLDSSYTRLMGIGGPVLRDSYHLGQTIANDYGRPYQTGFNALAGASTVEEWGPFSLYVRGEYQHSPSATGYSFAMSNQLSIIDNIFVYAPPNRPQPTIPEGPIDAENPFRIVEASLSGNLLKHEISFGKTDAWLGPAAGGAMAWSNNAENIYSFRVNRVEPMYIPWVDKVFGPLRYDFFIGSLKGHTAPNSPWVHSEMFSFRPTTNFEFGFQRTIIFGGEAHAPVTLHLFLKGFFDFNDTTGGVKQSRNDPGARFSDFSFSYRLPFVRKYATLYLDSISHDDVTPISAPRRAAYRTGVYISQFPRLRRLDFRAEGVTTDPGVSRSQGGTFNYFEVIQLQGYTNKGFIMGDWIGREAKGGQAWLTYHLSGNEWVQLEYLNKKTPKDFIPGGTTQNEYKVSVVKRLGQDVELNAWLQYERWKAPFPENGVNLFRTGLQNDTVVAAQFTWFPKLHNRPSLQ